MNILFLMADEFRFNAAGFMGNTLAHTPHLDRLAQRATVSTNAYTPAPVCVPARQCLATGKYPLHTGCERFADDIPPGSQTFARWFAEHGYYTVACGKLHHRGPDPMQGWLHRIGSETAVRWPEKYSDRAQIGRRKWRGAEELKLAGAGLSPLAMHDDYSTQGACDFVRMHFGGMTATPPETPTLLMLSLQQPHFPLLTEQALLDKYREKVPIFWNQPPTGHINLDRGRLGPEEGITEEDVRRATAAYYGMIEQTDRRFGRLLTALGETGQNIEDWMVVFTADHGDMLGQHGVWEKRSFYEGSARVPLFISAPGLSPRYSDVPMNLVDLFPTMANLAGLPIPEGLDGQSLFASERAERTFSQYDRDQFMLRRENWKYLRYPTAKDVLFDLANDPEETTNLIDNAAYAETAIRLRSELEAFIATSCTPR
jgi:choline-sulfatase